MKRSFASLGLAAVVTFAVGLVSFGPVFNQKYGIKPDSKLGKARCAVCHIGMGPKVNAYGRDMAKALGGAKKLTPDMLVKVEGLDSDGDGVKNLAEIKGDANPGDPKSKP